MAEIQKTNQQAADSSVLDGIKSWKIVVPIVIGLGATAYLFSREYEPGMFSAVHIGLWSVVWFVLSFGMMAVRDLGYMVRIRVLSDYDMNWKQAFRVIMLWEFASAVTPSAVGGTSVAIFFVNREGINIGRSTGIVMVTSFLDELFFALVFPIAVLLIGSANVFGADSAVASNFIYLAWTGYSVKVAYILLLSYGFFINPRGLKRLLLLVFKLPLLRRWRAKMDKVGDDMVSTSAYFRQWPFRKWVKAFAATCASWIARYWVVNTLIVAFLGIRYMGLEQHFIVFGKQLAMWIMMLVSPTPGGSGFAEWVFKEFLSGFLPIGMGVAMALCWRLVSYYPYLIMGAIILPKWVRNILHKK
ncbi:MAG: flippase-like domain-containing protein [Bacteroidales bacterium]|nr:flippase-like domain-containing protein [Bacteroidales bacterium]